MDKVRKYKSLYSSICNTFAIGEGETITPASVTGLPQDTEITLTFDRVDSAGNKTPAKMERIRGKIVGGNFVISQGGRGADGTTEQVHTAPVVEMIWNADDWNDTVDHILTEHNQDGTHKDTLVTSLKATGAEINTGTEDAKVVTPKALADSDYAKTTDIEVTADSTTTFTGKTFDDELRLKQITTPADPATGYNKLYFKTDGKLYYLDENSVETEVGAGGSGGTSYGSIFRQAIINGNFDVWQRNTTIAMTTANAYTADRWYCETATAGTDKTVSREDGTGVNGSYYCARVKMVSDVDELLTFSQALESQDSIKFRGKKLTLSFYARGGAEFVADNSTLVSKIVTGKGTDQKVLAFTASADGVSQNNTLTTSWQKFTCTTTAAIASDITQIGVSFAFTHAGSGTTTNYFEITQVQLCAGDVALPFMPKSFEEELRACQRYYEKSYLYTTAPGTAETAGYNKWVASGTYGRTNIIFKATKRSVTTVNVYSDITGTIAKVRNASDSADVDAIISNIGSGQADVNFTAIDQKVYSFHWTADAEL